MRRSVLILLVICLGIAYNGCSPKKDAKPKGIPYSIETAEVVSHLTSGTIDSNDSIIVRFVNPEIDKELVGSAAQEDVLQFSPKIKGTLTWKDRRTLVFKPGERLSFHTVYNGELQVARLLPKYKELKPISLQFSVGGRELRSFTGDFEVVKKNNPSLLRYKGKIHFTEPMPLEEIKKAVTLPGANGPIPLEWEAGEKNMHFTFVSAPVKRTNKTKYFSLEIDKKKAQLPYGFKRVMELAPLQELIVTGFRKLDQGETPAIEISFSDDLDLNQDKTGLVRVERESAVQNSAPEIRTTIKTLRKSLYVEGNFTYGETISLKVSGIRSKWGTKLNTETTKSFAFKDKKPELAFISNGIFMPSANQQKLSFKTINLKSVEVEIKKVYESNLGQFLQTEKINSTKKRKIHFNGQYVNRVGVVVASQTLDIGKEKNKWLTHQLDLKKLIKPGEKGLFLVSLRFFRADMLYTFDKSGRSYYGQEYYSNPNSTDYANRHGRAYKPVTVSDIGLLYKQGGGNVSSKKQHLVFATDVIGAKPMKGVKVTLRCFRNQVLGTAYTDSDGKAVFKDLPSEVYYIEGEKNGQRSFIKPDEMAWNISSFNTGGVEDTPHGVRAFIYTERGVYRPGDQINLSLIARNNKNAFPQNHPVTMWIYNPKNQVVDKITKTDGKDGFYTFTFATKPGAPTGNWRAVFQVGSAEFTHPLKIETVAPYRLKVNIQPTKTAFSHHDETMTMNLDSKYLFGSPAASLKAEVSVTLTQKTHKFQGYPGFLFDNEAVRFKSVQQRVFDGSLDKNGHADVKWDLPDMDEAPSILTAQLTAKVFEKGGRPSRSDRSVTVHPFDYYMGIQKPKKSARAGATFSFPVILVNKHGKPVPGRSIKYTIYKNSRYWWWEYDNVKNFRVRYKKDHYTRPLKEGMVVSQTSPVVIEFTPDHWGEYLVEVEEAAHKGHCAGVFFSSYWGDNMPGGGEDSIGTLTLTADKTSYSPGERARVLFPKPGDGMVLLTIEKGGKILESRVYDVRDLDEVTQNGDTKETKLWLDVPLTKEMIPNAYVSVAVMQPHSQTKNDRPLRMYGIIPLMVKDPDTQHDVVISMPGTLKSRSDFNVDIQTSDNTASQFTIAVVDEGLLDITRFNTPNPWAYFFKKQRLSTRTFDLFSYVLGAHKGDIARLFSIGGDIDSEDTYRSSQTKSGKSKRFKPVAMFKGPLMTDETGHARVSFKMPNYIGSVRVMVISARGGSYGRAEKAVPVKTDLMVLPTLPRVLGPGDKITVPVSVFAMNDKIKKVAVSIDARGPLEIVGANRQSIEFNKPGEQDVKFNLKIKQAVGPAVITVKAVSAAQNISVDKMTEIEIRPSSPRIYDSETLSCEPGKHIQFIIPNRGIPGSNRASISVLRKSKLNLGHRMDWLIRYPYGCIEQTTSSVFPQLYLKVLLKKSKEDEQRIDKNINAGIHRLRSFRTASGGFSYWPGGSHASNWGTNYGFHFLVEAKKRGYYVPEDMLKGLVRYQKSRTRTGKDNRMEQTYRLYILALANEPEIGAMNLLRENHLSRMSNPEKWLLAAAYYLSGRKETAAEIIESADTSVREYSEFGGTYGSSLRDRAMILDIATLISDWNRADVIYETIANELSNKNWHSTQTLGYSLLAVGKYLQINELDDRVEKPLLAGYIKLPGKERVTFETDQLKFAIPVEQGFGKKAEIYINSKSTVKRAFVLLEWDGVPLDPDIKDEADNLHMTVEWLDRDGKAIDPAHLPQGTTFWGHFRVKSTTFHKNTLEELALVQVLPSGWEIENIRLIKEEKPSWMSKWVLNKEEYLDIRDDRIMWFFDLPNSHTAFDFVVKLNAVTSGEFTLPPTLFEAMYNHKYKALKTGGKVIVSGPKDL